MESIRQYFLTVTAAAILCAIVNTLAGKQEGRGGITKLLCSLFLAFTVIQPIAKLKLDDLSELWNDLTLDASAAVSTGEEYTRQALCAVIKEETEAYILDRARELELELSVEVSLAATGDPVPNTVSIQGSASPAAKARLQRFIAQDLGIGEEYQIWIP